MKISAYSSFILLISTATFSGCDAIRDHFAGHLQHAHDHGGAAGEHIELSLNNGKKWKADEATFKRIYAMQKHIAVSREKEAMIAADYASLQKTLQSEVKDLIQGCKMTGQEHEELHKFLGLLNSEINRLASDDIEKSKTAMNKIEELLLKFSIFFS